MRTYSEYSTKTLSLAITLVILRLAFSAVYAQTLPTELHVVVVQGEGATSGIRQLSTSQPLVRVEDEKQNPVADAVVVFTLPTEGPTGVFSNGSKTLTVTTGQRGLAAATGLRMNGIPGKVPIFVSVSFKGLSARTIMTQFSEAAPGAKIGPNGGHGKLIAILLILGGGAAGGVVAATHNGGSSPTAVTPVPSGPTPIGITTGTGSIAPPH